jgi:uncharacterized protein YdaU (DUF1376 family)
MDAVTTARCEMKELSKTDNLLAQFFSVQVDVWQSKRAAGTIERCILWV